MKDELHGRGRWRWVTSAFASRTWGSANRARAALTSQSAFLPVAGIIATGRPSSRRQKDDHAAFAIEGEAAGEGDTVSLEPGGEDMGVCGGI